MGNVCGKFWVVVECKVFVIPHICSRKKEADGTSYIQKR
jgi:hypothetical protein